jgi:flagellar biosynthesis repressor protein FlbT
MGLKVELKPGERLILGECLITNGSHRTRLLIEGQSPILREKEIMLPVQADSPAKRIYLVVQLMYTARDPRIHHATYFSLMRDLVQAAPSAWPHMAAISNNIMAGDMYRALKSAKALIAYEKELLDHATSGKSLRRRSQTDRKSA